MSRIVKVIECFNIYAIGKDYIVHNTTKDFQVGHTHIRSMNAVMFVIASAISGNIPKTSNYLLGSIARITNNKEQADAINAKINKGGTKCKV